MTQTCFPCVDQMLKERPIIFSSEMIRAILEVRKTQTRRPIKPLSYGRPKSIVQKSYSSDEWWVGSHPNGGYFAFDNPKGPPECILKDQKSRPNRTGFSCPYGKVGDRLWVKETYDVVDAGYKDGSHRKIIYKATDPDWPYNWAPSIFMPRWASRINLKILGIRVERLQEITPDDCLREGIPEVEGDGLERLDKFEGLWNLIYGKDSWNQNPWVWVIGFKKI